MKSLLEAAIAIVIVYLFLEYFKKNQASLAVSGGGGSVVTGAAAASPTKGCCCGGGGTGESSSAPKINVYPVGPIGYSPITNIGFSTAPVVVPIASVPPSPAPVPRINYQINA